MKKVLFLITILWAGASAVAHESDAVASKERGEEVAGEHKGFTKRPRARDLDPRKASMFAVKKCFDKFEEIPAEGVKRDPHATLEDCLVQAALSVLPSAGKNNTQACGPVQKPGKVEANDPQDQDRRLAELEALAAKLRQQMSAASGNMPEYGRLKAKWKKVMDQIAELLGPARPK